MIALTKPQFDEREVEAVRRVLSSGWVVQGPEVEAFEAELKAFHPTEHCIVVSSATAALHLLFLALKAGSEDRVLVPSFAWPSAANAATICGARPMFCDVLPTTYNLDPSSLSERIRARSGGSAARTIVVAVHEFGLAADLNEIQSALADTETLLIEDAACALGAAYQGAPVGTMGIAAVLSFHPRKAITTGEGGAILTNDAELAENCRELRNHGQAMLQGKRDFVQPGLNYRMTEFQAAIGRVQLQKFPEILERRRALAHAYLDRLSGLQGITLPHAPAEHTWQTFMVALEDGLERERIQASMLRDGVQALPGSVAGHLGSCYRDAAGSLPVSERLHRQGLALPLHSLMTAQDVAAAANSLRRAVQGAGS